MNTAGKIDLRSLLQLARRRKWFLIVPPVVAILGAYYNVTTSEPVYRSTTTIFINDSNELIEGISSVMPKDDKAFRMRDAAEDFRKQLLSIQTLGAVVDRVEFKPTGSMLEQAELARREQPQADMQELLRGLKIDWLAKRLAESIIFPKRGNYVEISFTHRDPELAFQIVKTLADVFIEQAVQHESKGVEGTRTFSEEKLAHYTQLYEAALERLRQFKVQMARDGAKDLVVNATNEAQAYARIKTLTVDITGQEHLIDDLEAKSGLPPGREAFFQSAQATRLREEMLSKCRRLADLMVRFDWRDAEVIKINQDVATLRDQYRIELLRAGSPFLSASASDETVDQALRLQLAELDLELLRGERSTLEEYVAQFRQSLARQPTQEIKQAELQSEVSKLQQIVDGFRAQALGVGLKSDLQRNDADLRYWIQDPANRPVAPIAEDQSKILLIAIVGGLGFGIGAVYLLEFFDHSFKSVDEVESFLGLTVLGTIPRMALLDSDKPRRRPLAVSVVAISIVAAVVIAIVLIRGS